MFVTTFYSFKGGVGRTMALVNVAVELCRRGRTVLVVDFDLEAPGIHTFKLCRDRRRGRGTPGVVEYVTEYLKTDQAPVAEKFVYQCRNKWLQNGHLWVMPAGRADDDYGARLNRINWQDVYENRQGYLLMEDLKHQWQETLEPSPDYVLIDSRTGHTDISGICTRQFPDLVVLMYFPNDQNLVGMKIMVEVIRAENKERRKPIEQIFVASNVPKLDDEYEILQKRRTEFEQTLKFDRQNFSILHHYDSLDLVEQKIFTAERTHTGLARQYRHLADQIVSHNLEDVGGALMYLEKLFETREGMRRPRVDDLDVDSQLIRIGDIHSLNGEVNYRLSFARARQGRFEEAARLINQALKLGYVTLDVHATRIRHFRLLGRLEEAQDSMLYVLTSPDAQPNQLVTSLRGMVDVAADHIPPPEKIQALGSMEFGETMMLVEALNSKPEHVSFAAQLIDLALKKLEEPEKKEYSQDISGAILTYIGAGRFEDATALARTAEERQGSARLGYLFNLAIADWGVTGHVDRSLMEEVLAMHEKDPARHSANYKQCMAIAYGALGRQKEAMEHIESAEERNIETSGDFSGWSYLRRSKEEFQDDLEDMKRCLRKNAKFIPLVLRQNR